MRISIFEPITDDTANRVVEEILYQRGNRKDEYLFAYINSPGGDVDAGYAIYEAMRLSGKYVVTYAANHIHSCAIIIYLAGEQRFANNYSNFLIHNPYHEIDDRMTVKKYKQHSDELEQCIEGYFKIICDRSKLTIPKIKKKIKNAPEGDWFFKADEAMSLGIAHQIGFP
jgi:ATP-dependent Clp protease protease subunit